MIESRLPLTLRSERGLLRQYSDRDWHLELQLSADPDVVQWTLQPPDLDAATSRKRVERMVAAAKAGRTTRYVIELDGADVGVVGIARLDGTPEIFYALLPAARGKGLATAAANAASGWALEHGADAVTLLTISGNAASEAVADRAGFLRGGTEDREQHGVVITMNRWEKTAQ